MKQNKRAAIEAISREFRALPASERLTENDALTFALKAMKENGFHDYQEILARLTREVGRP